MMTGGYVLLFSWVLALYITVVTSQGRGHYSCSREMEGQQVDGPCGQKCICLEERMEYCCRQRKNFASMTRTERLRYVNTIIKLSTHRRYRKKYNKLIGIHKSLFDKGIHNRNQFLPWHRWFLLYFENLLRTVDCRVTLPYWDWSLFSGAAWENGEDDIFSNKDWGLGGDGKWGCVKDGRFSSKKKWRLTPSGGNTCLKRGFSNKPPDILAIHVMKSHSPKEFFQFELDLRANLHDTVHCRVGGTMCDHNSANAPEFFLHHAFIDKIWADWQEKSDAHRKAYFPRLPRHIRMNFAQFPPRDYIDTLYMPHPEIDKYNADPICVVYQDPVHPLYNEITKRLESLSVHEVRQIPRRSFRPATRRQMQKLGVKRKERRKARKLLKKELQPKKRLRSKQLRKTLEKMLGFRLDDIPFRFSSKDSPARNTTLMQGRWMATATNAASSRKRSDHFRKPHFTNSSNTMV